jgi:phosphinothricin acetyltransferase
MKIQPLFRVADISDLPEIVSIYNSTVASRMVTADTEPVTVESRKAWFKAHDPARRPLWVIVLHERIAGWISYQSFYGRPAYNGTIELSIYLHSDFRGKGLGSKALDYAISRAGDYHVKAMIGIIFSHNIPSLRLFETKGFEHWGELPEIAEIDGKKLSVTILGKHLD